MENSLFVSAYKVIDRKLIEIPGLFDFFNEKQQHGEILEKAHQVAEKESFNQPVLVESSTDYNDASEISVWVNGRTVFYKKHYDYEDDEICLHKNQLLIEELNKLQVPARICKDCSRLFFTDPPS